MSGRLFRGRYEIRKIRKPVLPEQRNPLIVLHIRKIGGVKYAAHHGGGNNLGLA